jgi:NADPH-dependent curcumin reductase CurA
LPRVGGNHLEAAIESSREFGRIAWMGAVDDKGLTLRGYMVRHHLHLRKEAHAWLISHLRSGALRADEQLVDGFENTVGAFLGVLRGDNVGKTSSSQRPTSPPWPRHLTQPVARTNDLRPAV